MSLVCCRLHLSHLVNLTHDFAFLFSCFVLVIFTPPPPYFSCFNRFRVQAVFCLLTRYFSLCLFSCGIFIALARWVRLPSKLPYYFVIFPKLYFVFDFVPFFRFLTLSFSSQFLYSKVPWKRTGQSCPKRRDKENSCAGAEGELKEKLAGDVACLGGLMVEHQPRLLGSRVRFPAGAFAIFSVSAKASLPISLSLFPFLFLSHPLPFLSSSSPFDLAFAL